MPPWPKDRPLGTRQVADPIYWTTPCPLLLAELLPEVADEDLAVIYGDWGRTTSRIRTYGHLVPGDKRAAHFLTTRRGLPMHTDTGYTRFTHHLILRNDGLRIHGLADPDRAPLTPGTLYCLDTWSPHTVVRDTRLGAGLYKLQAAVDDDRPLDPDEVTMRLLPLLQDPLVRERLVQLA